MNRRILLSLAGLLAIAAAAIFLLTRSRDDRALAASLDAIVSDYRKIIVLMDSADTLDEAARARSVATGQFLFYRKQRALRDVAESLSPAGTEQLIRYLTGGRALHDADKLAFLDLIDELADGRSPDAPKLRSLLDNLQSIQLAYREEVTRIFSQFATRGASGGREKWDSYVADLRQQFTREKVLAEFASMLPDEPLESTRGGKSREVFGTEFPDKTVALTFDDGPHLKYTEQVLAILRKYGLKATFFQVGYSQAKVDSNGDIKLLKGADVSKKILADGHLLANHSFSHPVLAKLSEAERNAEIDKNNAILEKISGRRTELFRAPYGARNAAIIDRVMSEGLRSIMWNINAEDWADPIPESIAMRILHQINQQHKGIIVLHDIHQQSVLAISPVVEELLRQGYSFLAYDKGEWVKFERAKETGRANDPQPALTPSSEPRKLYRESWAVIIGINDYQKWPKLRYAVNDATGMEDALVSHFGFQRDHIRKLIDGQATRQRIMEVLGDEFSDSRRIQREDRVFFFFAGHGATRTLDDGRQIGFIVPVDADRASYYSTAISMTALREAADLIPAKHVYFVMDSCYSGLALSRGGGAFARDRSYIEEITRRSARQILTAGGSEEQVADDGPNGHSVFTWALLQGLDGKADLDGNGIITASELGAYVSPIVSQFARQTPAVGNLVGSEGGEFIFELATQSLSGAAAKSDSREQRLTEQLANLEKQIAAKQAELLKLQQSIQSQSKQPLPTRSDATVSARAYEIERQGMVLFRDKKYDQALIKFKAAMDLKPQDAVLLNNLGYLYFVMGRYDEAAPWLEKTLAIDPNRREAHQNIADTYLKLGRRADAKLHYERFLALQPSSSRAEEVRKILESLN